MATGRIWTSGWFRPLPVFWRVMSCSIESIARRAWVRFQVSRFATYDSTGAGRVGSVRGLISNRLFRLESLLITSPFLEPCIINSVSLGPELVLPRSNFFLAAFTSPLCFAGSASVNPSSSVPLTWALSNGISTTMVFPLGGSILVVVFLGGRIGLGIEPLAFGGVILVR